MARDGTGLEKVADFSFLSFVVLMNWCCNGIVQGAYAKVKYGEHVRTGEHVAIKVRLEKAVLVENPWKRE